MQFIFCIVHFILPPNKYKLNIPNISLKKCGNLKIKANCLNKERGSIHMIITKLRQTALKKEGREI